MLNATINIDTILKTCPLTFAVHGDGNIFRLGAFFGRRFPEMQGRRFSDVFETAAPSPGEHASSANEERLELCLRAAQGLHIVGTFLPFAAGDGSLFVGTISPRHIAHVTEYGLTVSDFAPFDVSADFAMMAQVNEAVLQDTRVLNDSLIVAHDEAVQARKKIEAIALVDSLSGLANRHAFQQVLTGRTRQSKGEAASLLLIDIDGFKPVNDRYGHAIGDELIKSIGARVAQSAAGSVCYRIGGDEFAVLLKGMTAQQTRRCAQRIMQTVQLPHRVDGRRIVVTASGGLARSMAGLSDMEYLYHAADIALYEAKRSPKRKLQSFSSEMGRRELQSTLLERDLIEAIERQDLEVFVQPQFDILTGELSSGEALARWWNARLKRYIPPSDFIPIAERLGLVSQIDLFVFQTIVREQRTLGALGSSLAWSTNLSPLTLADGLLNRLSAILDTNGPLIAPVEVEITESALLSECSHISSTLRGIRDLGIEVAIDDFGAGQTSLSHLSRIPITRLKLDRSLIERIDTNKRAATVVSSIVRLAHDLGLHVTAEGIERTTQQQILRSMAPLRVQGFLYAKPMQLRQFSTMLCGTVPTQLAV